MNSNFVQFIKFGLVGVSNNIIFFIVYLATVFLLKRFNYEYDYIVGNILGFFRSVFWSYLLNNKFVFSLKKGETRSFKKTLFKTYISYGFTGIILNNILSYLFISICSISKYLVPLINLIITIPINFIINKFWAYKTKGVLNERTY